MSDQLRQCIKKYIQSKDAVKRPDCPSIPNLILYHEQIVYKYNVIREKLIEIIHDELYNCEHIETKFI
jgi:hypothetical protein